jgi:DNA polymerase
MDFETYSAVDIGKCGSFHYMDDPSFEPLLLAYAFDDGEVRLWDFTESRPTPMYEAPDGTTVLSTFDWPKDFLAALRDPEVTKQAWNCAFEREVIWQSLWEDTPPEQWLDIMHVAAQCGLPMSLDAAGKALGLSEDQAKMKEGKALINYFCKPCKATKANGGRERNLPEHAPEKWETFRDYCVRDVEAERTIFEMLRHWLPNDDERRFWSLDARINERGVRIDRQLAERAVIMDERYKTELTARAIDITGLSNPKSVSQIKNWLFDQEGKTFPSLNKKVIADVVSELQTSEAREFMTLRSELSKSSTAKYQAMLRSMCSDDHSKGCFQFYGANRTGRFAGRLVQFQNMSKNYTEDLDGMRELVRNGHYTALKALYDGVADPLSQLVRTAIIPEEGQKLLISDFSAIEARVTAWFAGEEWRLQTFRDGGDIYCASASQMFHVPVVKHGVNGELRQKGKVAELALGYGGGVNALKAFGADKMGMSEEEMQETVDLWRESSPRICELWRALEKAAIRSVARRTTAVSTLGNVRFDFEQGVLWMTLPSGRRLAYYGAKYEESAFHPDRKSLTYMGVDQQTKRWSRVETWGGKLVENLVQATARDLLREAMFSLDEHGFDIRAHVHDEVICTEPIDGRSVDEMSRLMCPETAWAKGLPLRADGYEGKYYFKD